MPHRDTIESKIKAFLQHFLVPAPVPILNCIETTIQIYNPARDGAITKAFIDEQHQGSMEEFEQEHMSLGLLVVARRGLRIIGHIFIDCEPVGYSCMHGILTHLLVNPNSERNGVGTDLIRFAEEAMRTNGLRSCHLEVRNENTRARKLYRKLGYTELFRGRKLVAEPAVRSAILSIIDPIDGVLTLQKSL